MRPETDSLSLHCMSVRHCFETDPSNPLGLAVCSAAKARKSALAKTRAVLSRRKWSVVASSDLTPPPPPSAEPACACRRPAQKQHPSGSAFCVCAWLCACVCVAVRPTLGKRWVGRCNSVGRLDERGGLHRAAPRGHHARALSDPSDPVCRCNSLSFHNNVSIIEYYSPFSFFFLWTFSGIFHVTTDYSNVCWQNRSSLAVLGTS